MIRRVKNKNSVQSIALERAQRPQHLLYLSRLPQGHGSFRQISPRLAFGTRSLCSRNSCKFASLFNSIVLVRSRKSDEIANFGFAGFGTDFSSSVKYLSRSYVFGPTEKSDTPFNRASSKNNPWSRKYANRSSSSAPRNCSNRLKRSRR